MKFDKNTLYLGLGIATIGLIYLLVKSKPETDSTELLTVDETTPPPATSNMNLKLQKSSKGLEVVQLQQLMGIKDDGIFGTITEARLFKLKGVRAITLWQYKNSPTINTNALPVGTQIMANFKPNIPIYKAIKKANGTFYTDNNVFKSVGYGQLVGTIVGKNADAKWYLTTGTTLFGNEDKGSRFFVKASDVAKI